MRFPPDWSGLGEEALRLLGQGEIDGARQLLDWARQAIPLGGGDDPYAGQPFARFWTRGSNSSQDEMRYAAAALFASGKHCEAAIPILEEGRSKAASDADRLKFDLALSYAYSKLKRYSEAADVSLRLLKLQPKSESAFDSTVFALTRLKRWAEVQAIAEERARLVPEESTALQRLAWNSAYQGNFKKAQDYLDQVIKEGRGAAVDYNNWAWYRLFVPGDLNPALEAAHRACSLTNNLYSGYLQTLAAVYAEVGKTTEAREIILHALDVDGMDEPEPHFWYIFGRIAEQFGEKDAAAAVYRKVTPRPGDEADIAYPSSTVHLAQTRLAALSGGKSGKK